MVAQAAALAFRAIAAAVFAAGIAALVAAAATLPFASEEQLRWFASIPPRAAAIGAIFLGASMGSFVMMPRPAALVRRLPPAPDRLPAPVLIIAVGSCLAVALQVPSLAAWWTANRAGVDSLVGSGPDPLDLRLVPATVVQSSAALAAVALLSFAVGSVLVLAVPARVVFRVLASCVLVQGALVAGEYLVRAEIDALGGGMLSLLQGERVETALLSAWLTANHSAASTFEMRLTWMLGAWLVAGAVAGLATRDTALATAAPAGGTNAPPVPLSLTPPSAGFPPGPASVQPAAARSASPFDQSNYAVRPRVSLNPFARRYSEYDIASIPPMSSARFSFSWTTGQLKHARDGRVLLAVAPPEAPGLFFNKSYEVTDGAEGVPIGTLVPNGADWTMKDASGGREVYVLRGESGIAFARFVASSGDREVCRFTWTIEKTVLSAGIEIEFARDADPALRSLAMALAPILELRSRLRSERHNT